MLFFKNNKKRIISLALAIVAFLAVFFISFNDTAAYASSRETEAFEIKNIAAGEGAGQHNMRPTREEIKEMEENAEEIKEEKWVKPVAIILCVLIFIVGLLMLLYPDFFIELSFFKYNQRNYWFGRGYTLNPTNADRIFTRILGVFLMLTPLISCILVYVIS